MHHTNVYQIQYEGIADSLDKEQSARSVHHLQLPTSDTSQQLAPEMSENL